ncbi:MAG: hypothetical protein IJA58_02835 [Lachnospiraceae bacterium]|nr:hypothetical protein [Lachnospiraceae bacterium]
MAKKKKAKRRDVWSKILVVMIVEVVLIVGIFVGVILAMINPFSGNEQEDSTQATGEKYTGTNPAFWHEGTESMTVTYSGKTVYAGGQVDPEEFEVVVHYKDGTSEEIKEYDSIIWTDTFRLAEGTNTITFYYEGLWANAYVYAVDATTMPYLPSYVLYAGDEKTSQEKVDRIDRGELTLQEAVKDIAFTGDSQIKALSEFNILPEDQVVAKVGESLNYMEENLNKIISRSWTKKALVVHYGINTLSTNSADRVAAVERYKGLLLKLKEALPNTRIIVSGLFPVADTIYHKQMRFAYIDDYNELLFAMCCEIGVEYLSDNEYISTHQMYFFGDGLHLKGSFYTEYWLKNLLLTMGI